MIKKWYAISGSRSVDSEVRRDVKSLVREVLKSGNGIVTGGAVGVDYVATQVVLEEGNVREQLKLFLPIFLKEFCKHYFRRAEQGRITQEQARDITFQLREVKRISPNSILDNWGFKRANKESYYYRNTKIVEVCDELYAFQVNDSRGTQDAIDKATRSRKQVHVRGYYIYKKSRIT